MDILKVPFTLYFLGRIKSSVRDWEGRSGSKWFPYKFNDLNSMPGTYVKTNQASKQHAQRHQWKEVKGCMLVILDGEVETGILETCWPTSLAYLASSRKLCKRPRDGLSETPPVRVPERPCLRK